MLPSFISREWRTLVDQGRRVLVELCLFGWYVIAGLTRLTRVEAELVARAIRRHPARACSLLLRSALVCNWMGIRVGVARSARQARVQGVQGELAAGSVGSFAGALRGMVDGGWEGYVRGCRISWRGYLKSHLRTSERPARSTPPYVAVVGDAAAPGTVDPSFDLAVASCSEPLPVRQHVPTLTPASPRGQAQAWRRSQRPVDRSCRGVGSRPPVRQQTASRRRTGCVGVVRAGARAEGSRSRHRRDPFDMLHRLFCSLFGSHDEFRMWVRFGPDGAAMAAALPGASVPLRVMIMAGLEAMQRGGYIDETFFRRLIADFGRRGDDILAVVAAWRWQRTVH